MSQCWSFRSGSVLLVSKQWFSFIYYLVNALIKLAIEVEIWMKIHLNGPAETFCQTCSLSFLKKKKSLSFLKKSVFLTYCWVVVKRLHKLFRCILGSSIIITLKITIKIMEKNSSVFWYLEGHIKNNNY